jgi:alpha-L-glutamate ligase-like protein/uncharacterized protein (TIGR02421 family)
MFRLLANHGILGLNARNLLYIKPSNPKKAMAFADDKLKTKMFLGSRGIPVAKVYARIENRRQLRQFDFGSLPDACVLKPNEGYGGEGIIVLKGRQNGNFLDNGKTPLTEQELREHIEDILDGKYSLSGHPDIAFVEQILMPHECFARFRPVGLPDIRIIVFNLVPVMAMLRIPTAESHGKANVHLGGIGLGLDIAKGETTHAAQYHRILDELPHGGDPSGIPIPHWEEILLICSRIQYMTNIGYLAVDITIDADQGPVLLEVNARAGLMVQVANLSPLRSRLERVKGLKVSSPEKGVRLGQELFGKGAQQRQLQATTTPVLGTRETIAVTCESGVIEVHARIEPDRDRSAFSTKLVRELKEKGAIEEADSSDAVRVKFTLGGRKIQTVVSVESIRGFARAVIGRRDLAGFLIDPLRSGATASRSRVKSDLRATDRMLARADRMLSMLRLLKPVNLPEERARAAADETYNPLFQYAPLPEGMEELAERLLHEVNDESPLGILLERKRGKLLERISLLQFRGNAHAFTEQSRALFSFPDPALVERARRIIEDGVTAEQEELLSAEQAQEILQEAIERYGLHDWRVVLRTSIVSDCAVGGRMIALRSAAHFSRTHVAALIAHEIETHVLTAENGAAQAWLLLRRGTAGYLPTQEGLAIWSQNRVLPERHPKRLGAPRSLLAVQYAQEHSFVETRAYLQETLGYGADKALGKAVDVKRGLRDTSQAGGFTKGGVYFAGLAMIERFVEGGGDLKRLYVGKVTLEDLDLIEKIPNLKAPVLLPEWLR